MATAYSYGRVSHADQVESESVEAQEFRSKRYYESAPIEPQQMSLKDSGIGWGAFFYDEKNVSASKKPFHKRKAGRKLIAILEPGDHVILDKVDRIWRSNEDFVDLMRWFKRREITVHFVNLCGLSIRMGTPMGDFILGLMVLTAQLESANTSDRIKNSKSYRRINGLYQGGAKGKPGSKPIIPLGCKVTGGVEYVGSRKINNYRLVWDEQVRADMLQIYQWHRQGFNRRIIGERMEKMKCEREGKPYLPNNPKVWWTTQRVQAAIVREGALQWLGGLPDPNTLNFRELDASYQRHKWENLEPDNLCLVRRDVWGRMRYRSPNMNYITPREEPNKLELAKRMLIAAGYEVSKGSEGMEDVA